MIRCLIVEDEEPAQLVLKKYIEDFPLLHLEKCVTSAIDAMAVLQTTPLDLIFLDIHLPKLSGLNFLRAQKNPPKVIITSAYPQYALEGYELDVVDYLLKPFSFERFLKAVNKVQPQIATAPSTDVKKSDAFVIVKNGKAFTKVPLRDVTHFKSDGDLVKIHTDESIHFEFQSLRHHEKTLPDNFVRVHKSYIVNLEKLTSIDGYRLFLDKTEIPIGRNFRTHLLEKLNIQ